MSREDLGDVDLFADDDDAVLNSVGEEDVHRHEESMSDPKLTSNLVQEFTRFREEPLSALKTLGKHVMGSSWRAYDDYVGQPLYYHGIVEKVYNATVQNQEIKKCIDELAESALKRESQWRSFSEEERELRKDELETWLNASAETMVTKMIAKQHHKKVLQLMYYTVAQMFSRTYHQGVHVDAAEITMIKEKAKELEPLKQSLIFMPCHKSHIDYIAIQVICFRMGISLPVVVAGDNLNFAVVGPMLRQAGGMYIRRSFSEDPLYQSVVQAYIETVLSSGYNFEAFVEGTRSRTGKLIPPKFGILKYILEAILSGRVEDSWIVPVSTQYDKVAEAESYATELLGKEKTKESFADFLSASRILSLKMGRVDVRFKKPWSLKHFVLDHLSKLVEEQLTTLPLRNPDALTPDRYIKVLRSLGYKILSDINDASVIMPTSLIGTVLLTTSNGRGLSYKELIAKVRRLIGMITAAGGRVGTVTGDENSLDTRNLAAMVLNGLKVLGPDLVGKEDKGLIETTYYPKDPFKLSYYRNQVIHLFASEALLTVALYNVKRKHPYIRHITQKEVLTEVHFLSSILSSEFVYPAEGLEVNFDQTMKKLESQGVVIVEQDGQLTVKLSNNNRISGEVFDFYCHLLWPFIDGYWLTTVALFTLVPSLESAKSSGTKLWVEEREFLSVAQALGKTLYHQGKLSYYEAVNKELLKGALNQLHREGVVERWTSKDKKVPAKIALAPEWMPLRATKDDKFLRTNDIVPSGKLYEISEAISECRQYTLRYHDQAAIPKGSDLILLRKCSNLGNTYKSKVVESGARL